MDPRCLISARADCIRGATTRIWLTHTGDTVATLKLEGYARREVAGLMSRNVEVSLLCDNNGGTSSRRVCGSSRTRFTLASDVGVWQRDVVQLQIAPGGMQGRIVPWSRLHAKDLARIQSDTHIHRLSHQLPRDNRSHKRERQRTHPLKSANKHVRNKARPTAIATSTSTAQPPPPPSPPPPSLSPPSPPHGEQYRQDTPHETSWSSFRRSRARWSCAR